MSNPIRQSAVAGQFYPASCSEIKTTFKRFNEAFDRLEIDKEILNTVPRAIIAPHAGYIYSGFTANMAYRSLAHTTAKRIIVIGPSHHHYFKGISGAYYETYPTPCGDLTIDSAYLFALAKKFNIVFEPKAHAKEHSTEVQMPFIQHYLKEKKVIELVYSDIAVKELAGIIYALLNNPDNAVVISSDLSHFHTLEIAKQHDYACLKAIESMDEERFKAGCEACGLTGIQALILSAKKLKLSSKLLDYRTSADASGDRSSVVGYLSAMFY